MDVHWTEELQREIQVVPEPFRARCWETIAHLLGAKTVDRHLLLQLLWRMEQAQQEEWKDNLLALVRETQKRFGPRRTP